MVIRPSSRLRAADGNFIDSYRRQSDADRHGLPFLPTGADPFVQLQIMADHRDLRQNLRPTPNQCRSFDRLGHLSVFDQIRLLAENTNLPFVISTWPPPNDTA